MAVDLHRDGAAVDLHWGGGAVGRWIYIGAVGRLAVGCGAVSGGFTKCRSKQGR